MKKIMLLPILLLICFVVKSQTTISVKDIAKHTGQTVIVCDSVYSTRALPSLSLINLGGAFPKELLTIVIYKASRDKFTGEPAETLKPKKICVTGKVVDYKGKPQIVVYDPKQIEVK